MTSHMTGPADDELKAHEVVARIGRRHDHPGPPRSPAREETTKPAHDVTASPRLLARLESQAARGQRGTFTALIGPRTFTAITERIAVEPPQERHYELAYELTAALKERVPQALLRDLARPVTQFSVRYDVSDTLAALTMAPPDTAKLAMATRYTYAPTATNVLGLPQELADLLAWFKQAAWRHAGKDVR